MRILIYIAFFFLLLISVYVAALVVTTGNLIENVIKSLGHPGGRLIDIRQLALSFIYTAILGLLTIYVILHIARAIRRSGEEYEE